MTINWIFTVYQIYMYRYYLIFTIVLLDKYTYNHYSDVKIEAAQGHPRSLAGRTVMWISTSSDSKTLLFTSVQAASTYRKCLKSMTYRESKSWTSFWGLWWLVYSLLFALESFQTTSRSKHLMLRKVRHGWGDRLKLETHPNHERKGNLASYSISKCQRQRNLHLSGL